MLWAWVRSRTFWLLVSSFVFMIHNNTLRRLLVLPAVMPWLILSGIRNGFPIKHESLLSSIVFKRAVSFTPSMTGKAYRFGPKEQHRLTDWLSWYRYHTIFLRNSVGGIFENYAVHLFLLIFKIQQVKSYQQRAGCPDLLVLAICRIALL